MDKKPQTSNAHEGKVRKVVYRVRNGDSLARHRR